jgi:hypothetical protein
LPAAPGRSIEALKVIGYKGYESGDPEQLAVLAKWLGY